MGYLRSVVKGHVKRPVESGGYGALLGPLGAQFRSPAERVLIAIQPASTETGIEPTPEVQAAIPRACEAISTLTRSFTHAV